MALKVKAVRMGYYDNKRRREGQEFEIETVEQFSHNWMEALGWDPGRPPEKAKPPSANVRRAKKLARRAYTLAPKAVPKPDAEPQAEAASGEAPPMATSDSNAPADSATVVRKPGAKK